MIEPGGDISKVLRAGGGRKGGRVGRPRVWGLGQADKGFVHALHVHHQQAIGADTHP